MLNCLPCILYIFFCENVVQGNGFKETVHHFIQPLPHWKCLTAGASGAGRRALSGAGHRGQRAFRQLQNTADGVIFRCSVEPISAAFSVDRIHKACLGEHGHNGLQILLGDPLFLCDLLQGYIRPFPALGKVNHHPQGIPSFC